MVRRKYNEKLNVLEVESIIADELFKIFKNKEPITLQDYYKNFPKWNKEDRARAYLIRNQVRRISEMGKKFNKFIYIR